jgi:hypothetical protein
MATLKLALLRLNLNRQQVAFWEAKIQHTITLAGAVRLIRTRLRLPFSQVFRSHQVGATRREQRLVGS